MELSGSSSQKSSDDLAELFQLGMVLRLSLKIALCEEIRGVSPAAARNIPLHKSPAIPPVPDEPNEAAPIFVAGGVATERIVMPVFRSQLSTNLAKQIFEHRVWVHWSPDEAVEKSALSLLSSSDERKGARDRAAQLR